MKKRYKILLAFAVFLLIILISIPFGVKKYINNNGKELIGRTINIESLSLNYFTGGVSLGQLLIYEKNDADTFLFVGQIYINPNVSNIIGENYVIQDVKIDSMICKTVLTDSTFNFNSIITHFDKPDEVVKEDTTQIRYSVEKITLNNSYISFRDYNVNSFIALNKFNTSLPKGISWNNPLLSILSSFNFTHGGSVNSRLNFNIDNGGYDLDLESDRINLEMLFPYLKEMMLVKNITGEINTDLFLKGNTNESSNIDIIGALGINDVVITDTINEKVMALGFIKIIADSINPAKDIYNLKAIKIGKPFVHFELYPTTDNFSQLFKVVDSTSVSSEEISESNVFVMIKDYVVETLEGIKASNFSIDTVSIENGEVFYKDHTLLQPFKYVVSNLNLTAYNVKSSADSLNVQVTALLNNSGELLADGILHPKNPENVSLSMTIDKLVLKDFSPYSVQYVAFPITKGKYNMKSQLSVIDKQLQSNHQLFLGKFKLGKKQKHEDAFKVPLKMGVAMLKNRKGNIDMEIPVEGDLSDPKYKVWKIVGKLFTEMLVKAATSPYKLIAGGDSEDKTTKLKYENSAAPLTIKNKSILDKVADVLKDKPELILLSEPYYNLESETAKLAMFKGKASYLRMDDVDSLSIEDYNKINAVNEKDSIFDAYIRTMVKLGIQQQPIDQKVASMFKSESLKLSIEKFILNKKKAVYNYLISTNVNGDQIKNLLSPTELFNDKTATKKVEIHLLFDVKEEDE